MENYRAALKEEESNISGMTYAVAGSKFNQLLWKIKEKILGTYLLGPPKIL